jgi:hypothetical protein
VILLGLNVGAASDARADVAYESVGKWFDAVTNGDHSGNNTSRSLGRCAGAYSGCNDTAPVRWKRSCRRAGRESA